jgi:hypothetical protein
VYLNENINSGVLKIFNPEVFQGSIKMKNYFEGLYIKNVSFDQGLVYVFIPGISLSKSDPHAFIQVINGLSGESFYLSYPLDQFKWAKNRFSIQIGDSLFTEEYIDMNINSKDIRIKGRLNYSGLSKYPKSFISPGIMGWYSFVPFMECYHGIVSANHFIEGTLEINSEHLNFNKGKGYIEKDWGISFPECWIWIQSNSFNHRDVSLFVSIAKVPWLGKFFIGFIAFLYLNGRYYKFTNYNRSKLSTVQRNKSDLIVELTNKRYKLIIQVKSKNSGELFVPESGNMSRRVQESINSEVDVKLIGNGGNVIFENRSKKTGLEIVDKIFDYL